MNGRVYDPVLGRFLSPDPLVQFPAFSQSWNRYSYVNNTPTSFTDPSGFAIPEPTREEESIDEIIVYGQRGGGISFGGPPNHSWFGGIVTRPKISSPLDSSVHVDTSDFYSVTDDNGCLNSGITCFATPTGVLGKFNSTRTGVSTGVNHVINQAGGITSPVTSPPNVDDNPVPPPYSHNDRRDIQKWIKRGLIVGAIIGAGVAVYLTAPIVLPALAFGHTGVAAFWGIIFNLEVFSALAVHASLGGGLGGVIGMGIGAVGFSLAPPPPSPQGTRGESHD